jgi:hypothetical protein
MEPPMPEALMKVVLTSELGKNNKDPKEDFLKNKRWLNHEICHIKQFEDNGFLTFIFKYLMESLRNGYYNNKYEIEARLAEQEL